MRIISGRHKGKRITAPKKLPVRPTTDMAKEGLFNILNNRYYFEELSAIDLFAGTGNMSYEFASRGASKITAVDVHSGCTQFISKTAKELDYPISVIKSDVFTFLERTTAKVDIIFADPPYAFEASQLEKIINVVFDRHLLLDDGLLILEHAPQIDVSHLPHCMENRKYGSSIFSFFEM